MKSEMSGFYPFDIFISHSSQDEAGANTGIRCWYAPWDISIRVDLTFNEKIP